MDWNDFTIGFWHPFGAHGGETRDEILVRKSGEAEAHGFTLWSFQHRHPKTLTMWLQEIGLNGGYPVFALCSASGRGNNDQPSSPVEKANEYKLADSDHWQPIPSAVSVPHHFSAPTATGFIVKKVIMPGELRLHPNLRVSWMRVNGAWFSKRPYPRGEYLIKKDSTAETVPPVYAVLQLEYPYVVALRR